MTSVAPSDSVLPSSPVHRAARFFRYIRENGAGPGLRFAWWKARSALSRNDLTWKLLFQSNPFLRTGEVADYSGRADRVWNALTSMSNFEKRELTVDPEGYRRYVAAARYEDFDPYYRGGASGDDTHRAEKLLQHYISLELLRIEPNDVYIDIASNTSPMQKIVERMFNVCSYSLDLSYPPGIHGKLIGADAGAMPFDSGFVSKMSLHCSFEHFASGADIRFVRECSRVLRPGGRVCIVPFYILDEYSIRLDPTLEADISVKNLEGARKVYVRNYRVDFGRFYSPQSFVERIVSNAEGLAVTVVRVRGLESLNERNVYSNFALLLEKQ